MQNIDKEIELKSFSMLISFYKAFVKWGTEPDMQVIEDMHKHIILGMLMMLTAQDVIDSVEETRIKDAINEHYSKKYKKER